MLFGVTYVHFLIILDSRVFKDHGLKGIIAQTLTHLPVTSVCLFFFVCVLIHSCLLEKRLLCMKGL